MRSWRIVLLMLLSVLLPLRSTLALTMGLPDSGALIGTGIHAAAMASADEVPCQHHGVSASPHGSHSDSPTHVSHSDNPHGQSQAHLLCDICNAPALGQLSHAAPGAQALPVGVPHRSERFVSVVLPIGHKPPIPA